MAIKFGTILNFSIWQQYFSHKTRDNELIKDSGIKYIELAIKSGIESIDIDKEIEKTIFPKLQTFLFIIYE